MGQHLEISKLLEGGESQTVEFKTSFEKETIETLVAFANAQGGVVLISVSDKGEIRGVTLVNGVRLPRGEDLYRVGALDGRVSCFSS